MSRSRTSFLLSAWILTFACSTAISADLPTEKVPKKQVLPSPLSPDMTVIGWVRADTIQLPSGANPLLVGRLNPDDPVTCGTLLLRWSQGYPDFILDPSVDVPYSNAWLLIHSANQAPPNTLDQDATQARGDYRLFNRFKAEFRIQSGQIGQFHLHKTTAIVGKTIDPCTGVFNAEGKVAENNGFAGASSDKAEIVQVNQGRIGPTGQEIDTTLNDPGGTPGATTPWIWSIIRFNTGADLSSNFAGQCSPPTSVDRQIFPTYSIYTGKQLSGFKQQCDPESFIALDQNSTAATP